MSRLADSFVEGGVFMYPIALLGCVLPVLALTLAVVALVSKRSRAIILGVVLLVSAILPAGLGVLAQRLSMGAAEEAIAHVMSPADAATIRAAAMSEAMTATLWGLGSAILPTFVGFALLGLGLSRLERFAPGALPTGQVGGA